MRDYCVQLRSLRSENEFGKHSEEFLVLGIVSECFFQYSERV